MDDKLFSFQKYQTERQAAHMANRQFRSMLAGLSVCAVLLLSRFVRIELALAIGLVPFLAAAAVSFGRDIPRTIGQIKESRDNGQGSVFIVINLLLSICVLTVVLALIGFFIYILWKSYQ